jgi:alkylation response protein AidB-like acyl-CoA dehydrogenase
MVIEEELARAGVERPEDRFGPGWVGPTIVAAGTQAQKERFLWPMLNNEEIWCQMFSEPDAGSDLAGLATRAIRDGDEYIVNGQKIWTSSAEKADFAILLARTDPSAPKHKGISYFILPMHQPGIEIRGIIEMTGGRHFNEVFLTDARVPAENLIGDENDGWRWARHTLASERTALSGGGALWGRGPTMDDVLDLVRNSGVPLDDVSRDRLASLYGEAEAIRLIGLRVLTNMIKTGEPGMEVAVKKLMADRFGQQLMDLAKDLAGPDGMLAEKGPFGSDDPEWNWGYLFSPALTIGGGTSEVLKGVVGERILGLPREPDPGYNRPWSERRRV